MQPNNFIFVDCFDEKDIIKFSDKENTGSIYEWCCENKMTIKDLIRMMLYRDFRRN